jgi:hypothetical protein
MIGTIMTGNGMLDWPKHDWPKMVRERMQTCGLPAAQREEVVAELAAHLEETYEDALREGRNKTEAVRQALQEVEDWSVLAANVCRAKSEEDLMNLRTRSLWLPALASLFASSIFLFVLTKISLQSGVLVRLNSGAARWLYAAWIISQVACGALGASLSRRVGGSRMARVVAATLPAIVILAACAIVIPVSALMQHNDFIFHNPGRLWWGTFIGAIVPAVMLLLGAAPFLQDRSKRHA